VHVASDAGALALQRILLFQPAHARTHPALHPESHQRRQRQRAKQSDTERNQLVSHHAARTVKANDAVVGSHGPSAPAAATSNR
jgi:hypothetical protein